MERREIRVEEQSNGSYICIDSLRGVELGRATDVRHAVSVAIEWLTLVEHFDGEAIVVVKPWHGKADSLTIFRHHFKTGGVENLWTSK